MFMKVGEIQSHPDLNSVNCNYDLLLLKLEQMLRAIYLAKYNGKKMVRPGDKCIVTISTEGKPLTETIRLLPISSCKQHFA